MNKFVFIFKWWSHSLKYIYIYIFIRKKYLLNNLFVLILYYLCKNLVCSWYHLNCFAMDNFDSWNFHGDIIDHFDFNTSESRLCCFNSKTRHVLWKISHFYTPTRREGVILQSPCPSVHTFVTDISASTGRNDFIFDIWLWHGDLYRVSPFQVYRTSTYKWTSGGYS